MFALIRSITLGSGRADRSGTSSDSLLFVESGFTWRALRSFLSRFFLVIARQTHSASDGFLAFSCRLRPFSVHPLFAPSLFPPWIDPKSLSAFGDVVASGPHLMAPAPTRPAPLVLWAPSPTTRTK